MKFRGGCHCGAIAVEFDTSIDPATMEVRACQCGFCRKHGSRAVADPDGTVTVRLRDPDKLSAYVFGLSTASYLVCRVCGVYVAAVTRDPPLKAIVNLACLSGRDLFPQPARHVEFDAESREERIARRQRAWTPCIFPTGREKSNGDGWK